MKNILVPKEVKILANDLIWSQYTLDQYKIIFNSNRHIKDLILKEASQFFSQLYKMYWDSFSITISRLTDKKSIGKDKCLSIYTLLPLVEEYDIDKNIIQKMINEIESKVKGFKAKRNKYIAHRDFKLAIKENDLDPKLIYLDDVKIIYENIGSILNLFFEKIENVTWSWEAVSTDDAQSLLLIMRDGIIYREFKEKRNSWKDDYKEENESSMRDM